MISDNLYYVVNFAQCESVDRALHHDVRVRLFIFRRLIISEEIDPRVSTVRLWPMARKLAGVGRMAFTDRGNCRRWRWSPQ